MLPVFLPKPPFIEPISQEWSYSSKTSFTFFKKMFGIYKILYFLPQRMSKFFTEKFELIQFVVPLPP